MINILLEIVGTSQCSDIQAEIRLDNQLLATYSCSNEPCLLTLNLEDRDAVHDLTISMQGKTHRHTVLDTDGTIKSDASILVSRLEFEGISMMPIFCQGRRCYWHSNNSISTTPQLDDFYGYIGCNGTVHIEFETPIYLWFNKYFSD